MIRGPKDQLWFNYLVRRSRRLGDCDIQRALPLSTMDMAPRIRLLSLRHKIHQVESVMVWVFETLASGKAQPRWYQMQ